MNVTPSKEPSFLQRHAVDILIFSLALIVRLVHIGMITDNPFFTSPILDAGVFDEQARQLVAGEASPERAYFQAPFYIYFLAGIYGLFGPGYLMPCIIQALLGALTAWIVYLLGKRLFGSTIGIIAGLIMVFYGPLIHYSGQLLMTTLFVFLVSLFLLLTDRLLDKPKGSAFLVTGLVFGLAAITRPNILIFLPFLILWFIFRLKDRGVRTLLFLCGAALMILPVTIRNYAVEKDFVLISSQAGVNFYMGNNRWATGRTAYVPGTSRDWWNEGHAESDRVAERDLGRPLKSSEISAYWWGRGWTDITEKSERFKALYKRKFLNLLDGYELSDTEDIYYQRKYSAITRWLIRDGIVDIPFGIILPLAWLGLGLTFTWRRQSHLLFFALSYGFGVLIFLITCRYRLPMVPLLAIWAAAGIVLPIRYIRERKIHLYAFNLAGFVALLILLNQNTVKSEIVPLFDGALNLANYYLENDQYEDAIEAFTEAAQLDSMNGRPHEGLGMAYLGLGRVEDAKREFENTIRRDATMLRPYNNLGRILLREGDLEGAKKRFGKVLELDSTDVFAHRGYADIALEQQEYAVAEEHYEQAYQSGATDKQIISRWAQSLVALGDYAKALQVNGILLVHEPNNPRIHHNQARIYMYCDSLEQAAVELETVVRLDPQNQDAAEQLQDIRQQLIHSHGN